jgi:general secretion pathway protein I
MKQNQAGFTLIEVLIALAILAIALVAVIKVSGQGVNATAHLRSKIAAHQVAMNILAEMQVGMINIANQDKQEGTSKMLGNTWRWHAKVVQGGSTVYERVMITVQPLEAEDNLEALTGFVRINKKVIYE